MFSLCRKSYCVENQKKYKCIEFDIFKEYNDLGAYVSAGTRALERVKNKIAELLKINDPVLVNSSSVVVEYL